MDWDGQVIMTSREVANFLKVHLVSVRQWSRSGKLKGYRLGDRGGWRYRSDDVIAFLHAYNGLPVKADTGEKTLTRDTCYTAENKYPR